MLTTVRSNYEFTADKVHKTKYRQVFLNITTNNDSSITAAKLDIKLWTT